MSTKAIRLTLFLFIVGGAISLAFSSYASIFASAFGLLLALLSLLWIYSLYLKDSSIIDWFWGPGFAISAWYYFIQVGNSNSTRNLILCLLVSIWALRLGIYIYKRNHGKGEDYRYQAWRAAAGKHYWWVSFFRVFLLQGLLMCLIGSVLYIAQASGKSSLQFFDYIGILLWLVGLYFEAVGDWQLQQFKQQNPSSSAVLNTGLWRYTRHPNYFGDALIWWGYFMFALATPYGWLYIFAPAFMTFLLLKVSGVALLEQAMDTKKEKYRLYRQQTSAFIPWPPKKRANRL